MNKFGVIIRDSIPDDVRMFETQTQAETHYRWCQELYKEIYLVKVMASKEKAGHDAPTQGELLPSPSVCCYCNPKMNDCDCEELKERLKL